MTDDGYRGPQVCKIVGITYRQLDYWCRSNLVMPSIAYAHGSGTQRRYSYADLVELAVVKRLLDAGCELRTSRSVVDYLREHVSSDIASATLVISGRSAIVARTDGEIVDAMRKGQGGLCIVLSLGAVVNELDAAIYALRGDAA